MKQSLSPESLPSLLADLNAANKKFAADFPGVSASRQPVHTVYGGAQLFTHELARKLSEGSQNMLKTYAPDGVSLARALGRDGGGKGLDEVMWDKIHSRVAEKLKAEAVEDFRIDFEDGYGTRPDAEEDGHSELAAKEVAKGMKAGSLPPFIGIRIKPFNDENVRRSTRTLDIFLSTLFAETGGELPSGFVVTLPKITIKEQSTALAKVLDAIEKKAGVPNGTVKFEIMVETTQAIFGADGRTPLREFVAAGAGRCNGAHFGTYDYTAGCSITAAHQAMLNPVCDFAKHVMQVSLAGAPIFLSDGATNIMPVGPHRAAEGKALTPEQKRENEQVVFNAWRISYASIRHSLETGYYQGWDLHPGQLPVRYATVYEFFLEALEPASQRLKQFIEKAAKATLLGDVFDDAATGQGLINFFLRGMSCGAISEAETARTGLTIDDLRLRSFAKILERRK